MTPPPPCRVDRQTRAAWAKATRYEEAMGRGILVRAPPAKLVASGHRKPRRRCSLRLGFSVEWSPPGMALSRSLQGREIWPLERSHRCPAKKSLGLSFFPCRAAASISGCWRFEGMRPPVPPRSRVWVHRRTLVLLRDSQSATTVIPPQRAMMEEAGSAMRQQCDYRIVSSMRFSHSLCDHRSGRTQLRSRHSAG